MTSKLGTFWILHQTQGIGLGAAAIGTHFWRVGLEGLVPLGMEQKDLTPS
jgi:hypothetical protein